MCDCAYTFENLQGCVYVYNTHTHKEACSTYIPLYLQITAGLLYKHIYIYTCTYIYVRMHTVMLIYIYIYTRLLICAYIHTSMECRQTHKELLGRPGRPRVSAAVKLRPVPAREFQKRRRRQKQPVHNYGMDLYGLLSKLWSIFGSPKY